MRIIPWLVTFSVALHASAQVSPPALLAYESFDYLPGTAVGTQTGGQGWLVPWWSGTLNSATTTVYPGFDALGGKLRTLDPNVGSYRVVDAAPWVTQAPNQLFGGDDTTVWVTVTMQRVPGSDDQWGGLSLFEQFLGERLFIGSPYQSGELGVITYGATAASITVPGTTPDALTTLVCRIDFMTGMDRIRLWLDPGVPHPDTPAAVDVMVSSFTWNEVRLQSGAPNTSTGYDFDGVTLEISPGPLTSAVSTVSAATGAGYVLNLDAGIPLAGMGYLLGGSATGYWPGTFYQGFTIPLIFDSYTDFSLTFGGGWPYSGFSGSLDVNGVTSASISIPPGLVSLVGTTYYHAGVVHDGAGNILRVTNAVPLTITP